MKLRGIHCAVVFHPGAALKLFSPQDGGLPAFVQLVNGNLRAILVKSQDGHMLQMSQNIEETLLYSRNVKSIAVSSVTLLSETSNEVEDTTAY